MGGGGRCIYHMSIQTKHNKIKYKIRCLRLSDEVWVKAKQKRRNSEKSWNLFIKELLIKIK